MTIRPIPVAQYGIGPIGAEIARLLLTKPWIKLVAAVDIDPNKIGRDLGEVIGLGREVGVPVTAELQGKPEVVCHSTGSRLREVSAQLKSLLDRGCHVVSTCEELSFPLDAGVREDLQQAARAKNVTLLGTGVNPGFVMDSLPIVLTAACQRVDRVTVTRVQDARNRRLPFQQKIGAGLTTEQFQKRVEEGRIKHVGFTESIAMIADSLGWTLDRISDTVEAKIAQVTISSEYLAVDPGYVCGIVQEGIGYRKKEPVIRLYMEAYLGAPESYDAIEIDGSPRLSVRIAGGVHGDTATAAIVVNSIPKVLQARPGLQTMLDMPLPSFFPGL